MNIKENTACFTGHRIIPECDIDRISQQTKIEIQVINVADNLPYTAVRSS